MKPLVPATAVSEMWVLSSPCILASPTSARRTSPSLSSRMLGGLMSLCKIAGVNSAGSGVCK
eukprot:3933557-Rhodomonas_salina.1